MYTIASMDGKSLSDWIDGLISRYPSNYIETLVVASLQAVYLLVGLFLERIRPPYSSETSRGMLVRSLWNHVVASLVHAVQVIWITGQPVLTRTFIMRPYELPSWKEMLGHILLGLLLRDVIFYAIHKLWHTRKLYKRIHAKHHEVKRPGQHHIWTISYMTAVDFYFLYGAPVIAAAKLLEMNIVTLVVFGLVSATGEQIKLICGEPGHDRHHLDRTGDYGVYWVTDAIVNSKIHDTS